MKANSRLTIVSFIVSFLVFIGIGIAGLFFLESGDEIGYVLFYYYLVMPIVTFITGFILGIKDSKFKWLYSFVFGLFGVIMPTLILTAAWDMISLLFAFVPALIGVLIGTTVFKQRQKPTPV